MKFQLSHIRTLITVAVLSMTIVACSVDRYIPEGRHMLTGVKVICDEDEVMKTYMLGEYVAQNTNTKWFGAKVPLKIYTLSGTDTTKNICHFFRKLGEAPVLYDSKKAQKTMEDIRQVLNNAGYMKADIDEIKIENG